MHSAPLDSCLTVLSLCNAGVRVASIRPGMLLNWTDKFAFQSAMWEPFGNAPASSEPYWKGAPKERGTFTI
jgi:hypothetical protein